MTLQMILALAILVIMIVLIMTDALPFGAPPILACCLLVVASSLFGADWEVQWDIPYAFAGFTNSTVWMVAFFMAVIAALQKTSFIDKLKDVMLNLVEKGGFKSYVLLLVVVMLGAILMGNTTGYYMLVLTLVATIPYNKKLPTSKLLMPLGFATGNPLVSVNVAMFFGIAVSILEAAGVTEAPSMTGVMVASSIASIAFLAWAIVGYKLLPDHPLADDAAASIEDQNKGKAQDAAPKLASWQEILVILAFVVSVLGMMFASNLGNIAYVLPGLCAFVLLFAKVINFKEMRDGIFSPLILMMGGVIPVANALADSGFTAMIGEMVAGAMGGAMPGFVVVLVFCVLTSVCATFTGSNMGSVFIFAPIAVATCMSLGLNPAAAAVAVTLAGWSGGFLPIDGLPALIMGMGNYTMVEFWKFSVPMYIVKIVFLALGATIAFPM